MAERTKRTPKPELTLAEIRARKSGRVSSVTIQLDGEIADRLAELRNEYNNARDEERTRTDHDLSQPLDSNTLASKIARLVKKAEETEQVFKFKAIGRAQVEKLQSSHPPTDKDRKEGREIAEAQGTRYQEPEWNSETYPPALIAASSLSPTMTEKEALELWSDPAWNQAELMKLWACALTVNHAAGDIPLGLRGIGETPNTGSNLTTPPDMESPDLDFLAE